MSPRRRLFAIALLVGALAATVALGIAAVFAGRDRPASAARSVPPDKPGPVLLVPGYGGSIDSLDPLASRLRAAGRNVTVVTLPGDATGDLGAQAKAVRAVADTVLHRTGAPSLDVVGYSAGGVVVRLWVRSYGGRDVVRRVLTLGSPHHGTDLAELAGSLLPSLCPIACQQLAAGSDLLDMLNRGDETPNGPQWVSLWSDRDSVVTPPTSARLAGALNVPLQLVCAGDVTDHGQLPADPLVLGLVVRAFAAAPMAAPSAADCGSLRRLGG